MAWIRTIPDDEADRGLDAVYGKIRGARGDVANILGVQSLCPAGLEAHLDLYRALMFGRSPLSRIRREMIAVVVSSVNGCHY